MKRPPWLLFILLLGFGLRVLWWGYTQPVPVSDFETYLNLAKGLHEHQQLGYPQPTAYRLPGYPLLLAAMMKINSSVKWLSLLNIFLSTLMILLVYRLAFLLTREKPASLLAAAIYAINPTFVFYSPVLGSEPFYAAVLLSSFLLLIGQRTQKSGHRFGRFIPAGFLYGAAVLTRGDGLFYLPLIIIVAYYTIKSSPSWFYPVLALLTSFVVTISPWYVRNRYVIGPGAGLSTEGGVNFYYAHNDYKYGFHPLAGTSLDGLKELDRNHLGYQLGFKYLANVSIFRIAMDIAWGTARLFLAPGTYAVYWSTRLPREGEGIAYPAKDLNGLLWFNVLTLGYYITLLGALFSVSLIPRYPPETWLVLFGIVVFNWIGFSWIFWSTARYRYLSEIVFCILGSMVMINSAKRLAPHVNLRKFKLVNFFL